MNVEQLYSNIGGDYSAIMARLGSEKLVKQFVFMFLKEKSYDELLAALEAGNLEAAFMAAHTLKGVTINLSLMKLNGTVCELVEQLRNATEPPKEAFVQAVKDAYEEVIAEIAKLQP